MIFFLKIISKLSMRKIYLLSDFLHFLIYDLFSFFILYRNKVVTNNLKKSFNRYKVHQTDIGVRMEVQIEKNAPLPDRRKGWGKWQKLIEEMDVGDAAILEDDENLTAYHGLSRAAKSL